MSSRPITEDDLNAYVDGCLDAARQREVAVYLELHPDVAGRVAVYRAQRDALRAAFAPVIEEPLPPELDVARMVQTRRAPRARHAWVQTAAAAVVCLCVGAAGGWLLRGADARAPSGAQLLAREATASYVVYAPDPMRPVELRASEHAQFAKWASERLGRPVNIPDLTAAGYRFMGGRVVATEHGPAALFMYDDGRGARLVMLARPMAAQRDMPMAPHTENGINGYVWADQGLGFSLVGRVAPETLHPIADDARRQFRDAI
ncbi:anti-sigma factor family protein [Chitinasiproducens palmae]|uniref:Transmembrane transcriptional regulator (Anti-sigma factor RsiW) n=1 Tax=Chitinasiproducens palmae TaxID=1770053 RepID=A0A1H2PMK1_9BURK|nr:anti-sigma factor [Chitinasiproducens palmae]SDV47298.1 Transmembrane transcriptional regulator (anti-sigma factor RsiW) [Chitinasiproducens palmae]